MRIKKKKPRNKITKGIGEDMIDAGIGCAGCLVDFFTIFITIAFVIYLLT